jgi:hypothetical protein
LARTDSERTYQDLKQVADLIKVLESMVEESKSVQESFSTTANTAILDIQDKVDNKLVKKIDEKCDKIFEKVKNEQNQIWKNCLGFTVGLETDKLDFLKDDKDIKNNYAYAVGGQDVFNIPDLKARSDTEQEKTVTDNSPVVEDVEEQIPEDVGENDGGVEVGDDDDGEIEEEIKDGNGGD